MVASSALPGNVADVTKLLEHPAFIITNPNSCYSVFLGFARSPVNFHAADGSGYDFMADSILKVNDPSSSFPELWLDATFSLELTCHILYTPWLCWKVDCRCCGFTVC